MNQYDIQLQPEGLSVGAYLSQGPTVSLIFNYY